MPPTSAEDFDSHMENAIQNIQALRSKIQQDVFFLIHPSLAVSKKGINGRQLKQAIESEGYSW